MATRTLYRSDTLCVREVACEDVDRWVITFDNHSIGAGFDRPGFGEAFLRDHGISAIHVMGVGNDWYQYPDIMTAAAIVRDALKDAGRRVAYGSSMGGYAALRLADAVGADAVLALSPQYSNDPAVVPWERRWEQESQQIEWQAALGGRLSCRAYTVVVYDAFGEDRRHADLIAADIDAILLPIRHAGHPVSSFLADIGVLRPMVEDLVADRFDAAAVLEATQRRRRGSSVHICTLADRQPAHRRRLALALARLAVERGPNDLLAKASLADVLIRDGAHHEALGLHREAVVRSERDPDFLIRYGEALLAIGRPEEARVISAEVVAVRPDAAHLRYWYAKILARCGAFAAAIAQQKVAIALNPSHPAYRPALARYRRRQWLALLPWPRR